MPVKGTVEYKLTVLDRLTPKAEQCVFLRGDGEFRTFAPVRVGSARAV